MSLAVADIAPATRGENIINTPQRGRPTPYAQLRFRDDGDESDEDDLYATPADLLRRARTVYLPRQTGFYQRVTAPSGYEWRRVHNPGQDGGERVSPRRRRSQDPEMRVTVRYMNTYAPEPGFRVQDASSSSEAVPGVAGERKRVRLRRAIAKLLEPIKGLRRLKWRNKQGSE